MIRDVKFSGDETFITLRDIDEMQFDVGVITVMLKGNPEIPSINHLKLMRELDLSIRFTQDSNLICKMM